MLSLIVAALFDPVAESLVKTADYYKGVTARFKQLISTAPDETEDPGNKYVTHFKAAENIDLSVTLTFNGNDSRLMFNVEDKTKK